MFRAEDIYAGNLLSALESVDQGITTTLDWSHGLRTPEYGEAALQAMREIPGRFVLAYGNYLGAPWEWSNSPEFRDFVVRNFNAPDDMMGLQLAFDVPDDPDFQAAGAFRAARDLGLRVTTHAGVFGRDDRQQHRADVRRRLDERHAHVRARRLAQRRELPEDRRDRRNGLGRDRERAERRAGLSLDVAGAQVRHPDVALDGHQRVVERRLLLRDALDAERLPLARSPRVAGARRAGQRQPAARRGRRLPGHDGGATRSG